MSSEMTKWWIWKWQE